MALESDLRPNDLILDERAGFTNARSLVPYKYGGDALVLHASYVFPSPLFDDMPPYCSGPINLCGTVAKVVKSCKCAAILILTVRTDYVSRET